MSKRSKRRNRYKNRSKYQQLLVVAQRILADWELSAYHIIIKPGKCDRLFIYG